MASGGASQMTGDVYSVGGTLGQSIAGVSTDAGNLYRITHGFWHAVSDSPAAPNEIVWAPTKSCNAGTNMNAACSVDADCPPGTPAGICDAWPNINPEATTRSLRFKVVGDAGPSKPEAIKVTMINLQDPNPPNQLTDPPPNFSGYEAATCAPMNCVGGTRNGLTCVVAGDCPSPGVCTALVEANGCARWVGKLGIFRESQDSPNIRTYEAARLQCTPYYYDWKPEGLIAVVGAEIAPSSEYSVEVYGASCAGTEDNCDAVSPAVAMYTRRSGDVEGTFNPPGTTTQPDVTDIAQLVNKFKDVTGALVKSISQLQPNLAELNADINALDIVAVVDAVKGKAYVFSGPCQCPSTVPCGVTSCSNDTPCVNAYGAGSKCVKTCVGGSNAGDPCINDTHDHCPGGTCGPTAYCRDRCGRCSP